jgi:hypothetical protein
VAEVAGRTEDKAPSILPGGGGGLHVLLKVLGHLYQQAHQEAPKEGP